MHDALSPLYAITERCEFCGRRRELDPHHVGGRVGELLDDIRFILLCCRDCHNCFHRMAGDDARAMGLALLRHAGRGGVHAFWKATGRNYPSEELVEHWTDRLTLIARA